MEFQRHKLVHSHTLRHLWAQGVDCRTPDAKGLPHMSQIISFDTFAVNSAAVTAAAAGPVLLDYLHNAYDEAGYDMKSIKIQNFFLGLEDTLFKAVTSANKICAEEPDVSLRAKELNALGNLITQITAIVIDAVKPLGSDVMICALDLYQPFARLGVVIRHHADHTLGRNIAA